ncbi:MAG: hypothetical protein KGI89_17345, partial [Euryarchaeota archaeon]|nr:hypothetical protein [Euryarchaeota archaeon]
MKLRRALLFLLLASMLSATVLPAYATGYANTVQAAFVGGDPACMPLFHYTTGSAASAASFEPYPVSNTADSGSILYSEA